MVLADSPAVNVRVKTLKNIVIQLAAPELARGKLRLMPDADGRYPIAMPGQTPGV